MSTKQQLTNQQKNNEKIIFVPSNFLQATPADFLSIFPLLSVTSQCAVIPMKLRLLEPKISAVKQTPVAESTLRLFLNLM